VPAVVHRFQLRELLAQWPVLVELVRWAGVLFLLYLTWKLAIDNGQLGAAAATSPPSFWHGAAIQWLNPKAWLAAVAGMGALVGDGQAWLIWSFAAIYFVVCYLSVACWAYAGAYLAVSLRSPGRVRLFNRCMAAVLGGCALSLLYG
jgi:threonine/homoserine/homoserine lactone efflux protein